MVRSFKNARDRLIRDYIITKDLAPSYFIENLIYNVPNRLFTSDGADTFEAIIYYLNDNDISMFVCQNEQDYLFGMDSWKWNDSDAKNFIKNLKALWESW